MTSHCTPQSGNNAGSRAGHPLTLNLTTLTINSDAVYTLMMEGSMTLRGQTTALLK